MDLHLLDNCTTLIIKFNTWISSGVFDFQIRVGQGRDVESRKRAMTSIFENVTLFLEPQIQSYPLAVSMEMREIDSDFSLKRNGIRDKIGD